MANVVDFMMNQSRVARLARGVFAISLLEPVHLVALSQNL